MTSAHFVYLVELGLSAKWKASSIYAFAIMVGVCNNTLKYQACSLERVFSHILKSYHCHPPTAHSSVQNSK